MKKKIEYNERRKGKEKERYSHAIIVDAPAFVTLLRCGTHGEKKQRKESDTGDCALFADIAVRAGSACVSPVDPVTVDHSVFSRVSERRNRTKTTRSFKIYLIIGETYQSNIETNLSPARKIEQ